LLQTIECQNAAASPFSYFKRKRKKNNVCDEANRCDGHAIWLTMNWKREKDEKKSRQELFQPIPQKYTNTF